MRKRVVLIDDDISCLDMMQMVIDKLDFDTYPFTAWESRTIQEIIDINPDLIILDQWLIGVKGSEVCLILKSVNQLRHVPVVLASESENIADIAKRAFADGYIEKPFDIGEIEKRVLSV